jgi:mRNA-degrading endonuclease RelE of RelBE toxin-antitoxin system
LWQLLRFVSQSAAHPEFTRTWRQIPPGLAGLVSEAISALASNPLPPGYEPIEGYENRYRLKMYNYFVYYEVLEESGAINLLLVEPEASPLHRRG